MSLPANSVLVVALVVNSLFGVSVARAESSRPPSTESLYETAVITKQQRLGPSLANLSAIERRDLLEARAALVAFLRSVNTFGNDATSHLTPELRRKFPSRISVVSAFLEPESSIIEARIYDFNRLDGGSRVHFDYWLSVEQEGSICAKQRSAQLVKSKAGWRIAAVE